eukprot:364028-Chlamydomonas_euryale.AAC.3
MPSDRAAHMSRTAQKRVPLVACLLTHRSSSEVHTTTPPPPSLHRHDAEAAAVCTGEVLRRARVAQ